MEVSSGNDEVEVSRLYIIQDKQVWYQVKSLTLFESNVNASGARLGPDQNGWPVDVVCGTQLTLETQCENPS